MSARKSRREKRDIFGISRLRLSKIRPSCDRTSCRAAHLQSQGRIVRQFDAWRARWRCDRSGSPEKRAKRIFNPRRFS
jgi:hypothetical protein